MSHRSRKLHVAEESQTDQLREKLHDAGIQTEQLALLDLLKLHAGYKNNADAASGRLTIYFCFAKIHVHRISGTGAEAIPRQPTVDVHLTLAREEYAGFDTESDEMITFDREYVQVWTQPDSIVIQTPALPFGSYMHTTKQGTADESEPESRQERLREISLG